MSGNCTDIEEWRRQLGDCIDSLNHAQQLLFNGHVISDSNSFAKSLDKLRGATADVSRGIVEPWSAESCTASSSNEMNDLTGGVSNEQDVSKDVDDFDSMLCDMDDDEFGMAVNTQPVIPTDVTDGSPDQSAFTGDMSSPCQQHVDKLKQVFGHSQFKP